MKNTILYLKLTFMIILLSVKFSNASNNKRDTIYYLVDLKKIPVKDRMISRDTEGVYHFYQINCSCADSKNSIRFLIDEKSAVYLNKKKLSTFNFISLPVLLSFVKKNSCQKFRNEFVLYFIEPVKKKFIKTEMYLVDDYKANVVN